VALELTGGQRSQDVGELLVVGRRAAHPEEGEDDEHCQHQDSGEDLVAALLEERRRLAGSRATGLVLSDRVLLPAGVGARDLCHGTAPRPGE
jgi:hypothetical protein